MADIDKLLTEAGERWRAGLPPMADLEAFRERRVVQPRPLVRPLVRPKLGAIIVVVALLAVAALVGTSPVGGPAARPSHIGIGWDRAQLEAAIVHPGDRVTATGVIIAPPGEAPKLCVPGADDLMGDPPACLPIAVSVEGVDLDHLPGRMMTKGTISSASVEVHGTWTGTAIRVASIGAIASEPYNLARLPCPAPQAGWPSAPSDIAFRAALDPLVSEITAKPGVYRSYWTVPFALPDVEIVETSVDPATIRDRVDALFPFSACLLRGTFASDELTATQTALHRDDLTWIADVEDAFHRVRVELTMLDEAAVAAFVAHPAAYPAPLVTRDSPSAAPVPTASARPEDTPGPTLTPQPSLDLVDGLPLFIDGEQVLTGDLARVTVQGVRDDRSILVGGWLHPYQVMSCPNESSPSPWNACDATRLFPSPFAGPEAIGIYQGLSGPGLPTIPDGSVQAVVLRIHTHDPACTTGAECVGLPVLEAVVWSSPVQPVPAPTSTRPPSGMAESAAIEAAIRFAADNGGSGGLTVVSAVSGRYADVGGLGGAVAADHWVWAVTLSGPFRAPDCASATCLAVASSMLVVFDYADGTFLISTSPAPEPGPTTDDAGTGAINLVSKFEIDRAAGNWDDAWGMLGSLSQQRIGPREQFISRETAYNAAGGGFRIDQVIGGPFGPATVDNYGLSAFLDDLVRAGGDPNQAELVIVAHPDVVGVGGSGTYLVAHVAAGWRIWIVN